VDLVKGRHVKAVAKKDLKGLANEKTILFAILLQLFVAMFSSFLMVGLTAMYDPSSVAGYSRVQYPIGYSGVDSPLLEILESRSDLRVHQLDLSTAVALLRDRQIAAVVYVPETAPDADEPVKVSLFTIQNDIQTAVISQKIRESLMSYEDYLRKVRSSRLSVEPTVLQFPETSGNASFYEFVYGLLIPLLLFMPAIICAALAIDLITEEFQHHTLETLLATPVTFAEVIWGKVLACILLVPLQAGAWLILLSANGISIAGIPQILVHVILASSALILLGALIALYYRERTAAQVIFSLAVVVLMMAVLALPENPFSGIVSLATGTAGPGQWLVLAVAAAVTALLCALTHLAASRNPV